LRLSRAVLIVVPVPEEQEFSGAEQAVTQATAEAERLGIHGRDVTPFLLRRVAELTEGASQAANAALLVNSARVAALIARELYSMNE
jgi:pseudouridine-5'-phosphate glycosidase